MARKKRVGTVVDADLGESRAVIKPLGDIFRGLPGISGSTVLGNGAVALISEMVLETSLLGREEIDEEF